MMSPAQREYTLVRVEGFKHEHTYETQERPRGRLTVRTCDEGLFGHVENGCDVRGTAPWKPPASVLVPSPPPDYSTPAAVSARALERGTGNGAEIRAAANDTSFRKLVKEFRALAPKAPCRVEDTHRSKWRVVHSDKRDPWSCWTLEAVPEKKPRRARKAVAAVRRGVA